MPETELEEEGGEEDVAEDLRELGRAKGKRWDGPRVRRRRWRGSICLR